MKLFLKTQLILLRRPVEVLLLCVCLLFASAGRADPATDEGQLLNLLDEFLAGASVNDASVHDRFWAADLIYTSSSGARFGKADIMLGLEGDPGDEPAAVADEEVSATRFFAEDQQVMLMGDTAVVAFRLVGETPQADGAMPLREYYFNTGTFRRRDGIWQAVAWQATRIPDSNAGQ